MPSLKKDCAGATAIEYSLVAALMSVIIIAALQTMGNFSNDSLNAVSEGLQPAAEAQQ